MFGCDAQGCHGHVIGGKPATAFLSELIALQELGTVARPTSALMRRGWRNSSFRPKSHAGRAAPQGQSVTVRSRGRSPEIGQASNGQLSLG